VLLSSVEELWTMETKQINVQNTDAKHVSIGKLVLEQRNESCRIHCQKRRIRFVQLVLHTGGNDVQLQSNFFCQPVLKGEETTKTQKEHKKNKATNHNTF
jgi:hypothetical protein